MRDDLAATTRTVDHAFVTRQRARQIPDAAIARMGNWCLADVTAVPLAPPISAVEPIPLSQRATQLAACAIPDVWEIIRHVAEQYEVAPEDILGHSHIQEHVAPRHEAMAVVFELNRYTLKQLGQIFNKTDNAILFGLRRHYERLRTRGPVRDW
jgi:DnaA-like protein